MRAALALAALAVPAAGAAAAQQQPTVRLERDSPFEIVRFNGAEGLSLGVGATAVVRRSLVTFHGRARYAFGDERVQGALTLTHVGAGAVAALGLLSEMRDIDPLAPGLSLTNTIPSLLLSHDEGAYVFATGAELRRTSPWRGGTELAVRLFVVDESQSRARTRGGLVGEFPPRTSVLAGRYAGVSAILVGGEIGGDNTWYGGVEAVAGVARHARGWAGITRRREIGSGLDVAIAGWAGVGAGSKPVPQRQFRLGGNRSLRGYDAGALAGDWAWNVGIDVGAAHRVVAPVAFVDAGQAEGTGIKASAGAGISVLRGVLRVHVATPLDHARARFDLMLAVRR